LPPGAAEVKVVGGMLSETAEARVERLVLEYAQTTPSQRPLDLRLSLRDDLAIESMSLLSLTVRLGDELDVDVLDLGLELGNLQTVGDLVRTARKLSHLKTQDA
jgi:acyl carrier protein